MFTLPRRGAHGNSFSTLSATPVHDRRPPLPLPEFAVAGSGVLPALNELQATGGRGSQGTCPAKGIIMWDKRFDHTTHRQSEGGELDSSTVAFAEIADNLVRNLLDTGLQLNKIGIEFDRESAASAQADRTRDAISDIIDDLDRIIRDAGLAVIAVTSALPRAEPGASRHK
ncbi:hypothetical protein AB0J47_06045 [Nocardia sp. NPDC049737]|uniref:hypothetical protein n=2 Tax=Nocardia TaxID=1817 RepID=UPI00343C1ADA